MESLGKNRLIHRKITSITLALLLGAGGIAALPPTALAAAPSNGAVSSTRSFPATTTTRRDLTRESVSTDVQSDSDWGGIENLIVPQTKSQAEKDAELKAQQEEETRKQAQEQAERQAQAQAIQQEEASRSAERTVIAPQHPKPGRRWPNMLCSSADTHTCTAATSHQAGIVPDSSNTCSRNSVSVSPTSQAVK